MFLCFTFLRFMFLCFTFLWLKPFLCLTSLRASPFYACGVSGLKPFLCFMFLCFSFLWLMPFEWLKPFLAELFQCLRRLRRNELRLYVGAKSNFSNFRPCVESCHGATLSKGRNLYLDLLQKFLILCLDLCSVFSKYESYIVVC